MSTDDYRKASLFATGSFDLDFPIPDLIGTTEILTEEHRSVRVNARCAENVYIMQYLYFDAFSGRNCAAIYPPGPRATRGRWSLAHRSTVSR